MILDEQKKFLKENKELYLEISAKPGASESKILCIMADGQIKISIKAVAEKGKANIELIRFLAKEFGISKDKVKILSGAGERKKLIKINL